jgi:hypothetical protein
MCLGKMVDDAFRRPVCTCQCGFDNSFFFDVSKIRSYKLSPVVVPLMEEKTKTDQDETGGVAVSRDNVASKKTEIGNAERKAKMLKDEIKSLDGGQRTAIILETNLKQGG